MRLAMTFVLQLLDLLKRGRVNVAFYFVIILGYMMKPLAIVLLLDIVLLSMAYAVGSFVGLALIMGLGFIVALGTIVFSTAPPSMRIQEPDSFEAFNHTAFG